MIRVPRILAALSLALIKAPSGVSIAALALMVSTIASQPASAGSPEGSHDVYEGTQDKSNCWAAGWAADPDDRNIDLTVRILSDGVEVAQTIAGTFRQDLEDAGVCPGGTCGFGVDLSGLITPNGVGLR